MQIRVNVAQERGAVSSRARPDAVIQCSIACTTIADVAVSHIKSGEVSFRPHMVGDYPVDKHNLLPFESNTTKPTFEAYFWQN